MAPQPRAGEQPGACLCWLAFWKIPAWFIPKASLSWPQTTPRDAERESMGVISGGPGIGTGHLAEAQERRWSGRGAAILQHPGAALEAGRT